MKLLLAIIALGCIASVDGQRGEDCEKPKDSGNGKDSLQKFYFNKKWMTCMGFKYSGKGGNKNRFDSYSECMGNCAPSDGSMCMGPSMSKAPLNPMATNCDNANCPKGYVCAYGMRPECCEKTEYDAKTAAFEEKCPDGSKAGGNSDAGYFQATFGESCKDLVCDKSEKCVQINKFFARCCGAK